MSNVVEKFIDLCSDLGVTLSQSQIAQATAKLSGQIFAASEKVLIAESIEAAAASGPAHLQTAAQFARGMARRHSINLECNEAELNAQLSGSRMTVEERVAVKSALFRLGAIAP